jgi:hypothetical protein
MSVLPQEYRKVARAMNIAKRLADARDNVDVLAISQ